MCSIHITQINLSNNDTIHDENNTFIYYLFCGLVECKMIILTH